MNKIFVHIFDFLELNEHQNINHSEQLDSTMPTDELNENITDQDMNQNDGLIEFGT